MSIIPVKLKRSVRALRIIWNASGWLTVVWASLLAVEGLIPVLVVWLTKPIVDGLQAAVGAGVSWGSLRPLATLGGGLGLLMLAGAILRPVRQWFGWKQADLVEDEISDLVHAQATRLDLAFFETPALLDRLYRVRSDAGSRPLALLEGGGALVQNLVTVVGIGALLLVYGWWIALVLLAGTLPAFFVVLRANREQHAFWLTRTADRRRASYLSDLLTSSSSAAEVRVFSLGEYFRAQYRALRMSLRTERLRMLGRQSLWRLLAEGAAAGSAAATIGWMLLRAFRGLATLGDVALFLHAFRRAQGLVQGLFGSVSSLYSNALFLENLFDFLDMEPTVVARTSPAEGLPTLKRGLHFRGVSFRYPGTDRLALNDFELVIPAGTTAAIVGENGAGKSTLVKLLARFYDPQSGRVEIDGVDLRDLDPAALHSLMTVMLQAPLMYQGTLRANIALSDVQSVASPARLEEAARDAGIESLVHRLPEGLNTLLGKEFIGGTELSGGEWQKIALGRAYFRRAPLIILDEPTSHLDSWSEREWLEKFQRLVAGATALIVTHRLSIARSADAIHVLHAGRIVESGTHDELLERGGRYASSWQAQNETSRSVDRDRA